MTSRAAGASRGPQLALADDDDDDDDVSQSEDDDVDSDVERLAAESINRRRRAAMDSAVAVAEGKVQKQGAAALEKARIQHEQELAVVQQEHATYKQRAEAALRKARQEGESEAGGRLEALRQLEEAEARAQAVEERLVACEAERDELEAGILHARDVCAQKDADAKAMADQHTAELEEAVARGTREAESRAADAVAAEAARSLATQERLNGYCEQLEAALLTARELATRREEQLAELEKRAALAITLAVEQATAKAEATAEVRQRAAMKAAMSAAEAAQTRAIDKALASERESYARAERVAEAKRAAQHAEELQAAVAKAAATAVQAAERSRSQEMAEMASAPTAAAVSSSSSSAAAQGDADREVAGVDHPVPPPDGAQPRPPLSAGQSDAVERALAAARQAAGSPDSNASDVG